jgi:hypothetical protein
MQKLKSCSRIGEMERDVPGLGRFGRFQVYRETDVDEADRETIIRDIIGGQYEKAARVVAFNTAEGWSRDISEDIAREIVERRATLSRCQISASFCATEDGVPANLTGRWVI